MVGAQSVQSYLLSRKRKPLQQTAQAGRVRSPMAKELFLEEAPSLEQFCWVFCWRYLSLIKKFQFHFLERIRGSPFPLGTGSVG